MTLFRFAVVFAAGVVALSASVTPITAAAGEHDGACDGLELCFYHDSDLDGAVHDFRYRENDLASYEFIGPGKGVGVLVKNNAASARNRDGYFTARIYYNSGFAGAADDVRPLTSRNLGDTYNDNASFTWCHLTPLTCDD